MEMSIWRPLRLGGEGEEEDERRFRFRLDLRLGGRDGDGGE